MGLVLVPQNLPNLPFQQIECDKLRILYQNTVIDGPYRQRLERCTSIHRPNSLDKVVENPNSWGRSTDQLYSMHLENKNMGYVSPRITR